MSSSASTAGSFVAVDPLDADFIERFTPRDDDVEHFRELGWWVSPPVLDDTVIERAIRGADRIYAGESDRPLPDGRTLVGWSPADGDVLRKNDMSSLLVDELQAITLNPIIGLMAARLAGVGAIRLWHDQLLYKPSLTATPVVPAGPPPNVGWHTDRQYWMSASSTRMLTAWVPFHDVREEHGPVMFVDGSHRWDGVVGDFWNTDLSALSALLADRDAHVSHALVPKGGISFHHCRTIHGSGPNTSGEPRRAIAVHLQDGANRYQRYQRADGTVADHGLDQLVRADADTLPDYTDPNVCPPLWPGRRR